MSHYLEEDWAELEKDSIIENLQLEKAALEAQVTYQQERLEKVRTLIEEWRGYTMVNAHQTWRLMGEVTDLLDGKPVFAGSKQL